MKTILYYFSGTGNTLMLAHLLAKKLDNTEIINIASLREPVHMPKADRIGILFPVYAFGIPQIVHNFVEENFEPADDTYLFALTNYATAGCASALKQLKDLLKNKGYKLNAGFGISMPSNYIPFGGAESHEKQNKKFLNADDKINKITNIIKNSPEDYFYKNTYLFSFIRKFLYQRFIKQCKKDVKKFYANASCTGCGICAEICPTQNITIVNKRPKWGDNCEQCMACLQWCPNFALQRKGVPASRLRYQNPGIKLNDLLKDMHRL